MTKNTIKKTIVLKKNSYFGLFDITNSDGIVKKPLTIKYFTVWSVICSYSMKMVVFSKNLKFLLQKCIVLHNRNSLCIVGLMSSCL